MAEYSSDQSSDRRSAESDIVVARGHHGQLLLSSKAPYLPADPDEVSSEEDELSEWTEVAEDGSVGAKISPESSEAGGMSGDDIESSGESSPSGSSQSTIRINGRRIRSDARQFESEAFAGREDLCCESVVKNSSSRAASMDDLGPVLDQLSIENEEVAESVVRPKLLEDEFERSPKELILKTRKRLVKKSTIFGSESDLECESAGTLDPAPHSVSVDYSSADDGDVDSPVLSKVKSKIVRASVSPKPNFPFSTPQLRSSSDAGNEHAFAPGFESTAEESLSAPSEPQPQLQPTSAINSVIETDNTGQQEDMVLVDGGHRFSLRAKTAHMLYPHQCAGIKWFWSLHTRGMGGILGDDMGLGKTMQVAAFLAGVFRTRNIKCALVVAPKTLIAHWENELKVVGLSRKTSHYLGTSAKARECALENVLQVGGILLTTYDMVRCNFKSLRGDIVGRDGYGDASDDLVTWDYIILDEGHLIKNPNTQRAKSLREIPAAHRVILSGTPIQNHLQEMWALFDFCCPNLLGDRKEFKDKYERQILAGTDKNASDRQKRIGIAVAEELRQKFAPFFLRRLKSDVFPDSDNSDNKEERRLSKKNDLIVWLPLSERQEKLYRAFLNSNTAEETLTTGAKVLSALTVMKKICDHPALLTKRAANDIAEGMEGYLDSEDVRAAEAMTRSLAGMVEEDEGMGAPSCKIDFLLALLENLVVEGHRTLIFAQTQKMLNIIQDEILDRGWTFRRIDGTIKAAEREQYVQEFQSDEDIPLFLLTSQVGGLGLTLTGADRVVIVDPAWNPSTDNQSVDRAYRIGQKKNVVVYRLMTCGTIEEKIYRKQVFKGHLMKVATEKKNQMRYFSQGELGEMFKVPELGFRVSVTQQQLHKEHYSQHKIDERLQEHIAFLVGLGIAGVSHHDLLFTKEAEPLPPPEDQDLKAPWEPRNPSYVEQQYKAITKPQGHVWDASQTFGQGTAGFQSLNVKNEYIRKVNLLRSKLKWLYGTLEDKTMLEETIAETWMITEETEKALKEAEALIAGSKENIQGAQLLFRSAASTQLSAKPFGPNNSMPTTSTLLGKINTIPVPVQVARLVPEADEPPRPSSSRDSRPSGRNYVDIDNMSGTFSSLQLRMP